MSPATATCDPPVEAPPPAATRVVTAAFRSDVLADGEHQVRLLLKDEIGQVIATSDPVTYRVSNPKPPGPTVLRPGWYSLMPGDYRVTVPLTPVERRANWRLLLGSQLVWPWSYRGLGAS